jgi:hypothetical protein
MDFDILYMEGCVLEFWANKFIYVHHVRTCAPAEQSFINMIKWALPRLNLVSYKFNYDHLSFLYSPLLVLPPTTITCPNTNVFGHILISRYIRIRTGNSGWRE